MELRQLRHFVVLAEEMHFGRAAQSLGITQPALSASVARLEASFGLRLFERDSKRVRMTLSGEAMLQSAREILSHAVRAQGFSRALADGKAGWVEVGFSGPVMRQGFDKVVLDCRRMVPDIQITLHELISQLQVDQVRAGKLDAGVVTFPHPPVGLEHIALYEDRFVMCLPARHRLARHAAIDIDLLREESFIVPKRDRAPNMHDQLVGLCATAGFFPQVSMVADSALSTLHLIAQGMGVGFVLESLASLRVPGTRFVPLSQPLPGRSVYFIWNPGRVVPGLEALIDGVRLFARSRVRPAGAAAGTRGSRSR